MDLWVELGATMRRLRENSATSLRDLEAQGRWTRSTLSQAERGRSRPSRLLVDWYESQFGGDGLLAALYVEARSSAPPATPLHRRRSGAVDVEVTWRSVPAGHVVVPDSRIDVGFRFRNVGHRPWRGRTLVRVGTHTSLSGLSSPREVPLPDADVGAEIAVLIGVTTPAREGSAIAFWEVVDSRGNARAALGVELSTLLVVRSDAARISRNPVL